MGDGAESASRALRPPVVLEGIVLHDRTSLRVGGPAHRFAEPGTVGGAVGVLAWAVREALPIAVLGGGTNTVFSDRGHDGLVLSTRRLLGVDVEGTRVAVSAGEPLARLAWRACSRGLSGLEWACGIPGTVGGAVAMNAGAYGGELADSLTSADLVSGEGICSMSARTLGLRYRTSAILEGKIGGMVARVILDLGRDDPEACIARARTLIAERVARLPVGASAGCVFRNPAVGPPAGQLLDRAGCKGMRVGRAVVSARHANVVVNEGADNAAEVLDLIDRMKARVLEAFGVELQEEIVVHR